MVGCNVPNDFILRITNSFHIQIKFVSILFLFWFVFQLNVYVLFVSAAHLRGIYAAFDFDGGDGAR